MSRPTTPSPAPVIGTLPYAWRAMWWRLWLRAFRAVPSDFSANQALKGAFGTSRYQALIEANQRLKDDVTDYGAALGRAYPAARAGMFARAKLIDLMEGYRADGRFAEADALRAILRDWSMPLIDTRGCFTPEQDAINASLEAQALKAARGKGKSA